MRKTSSGFLGDLVEVGVLVCLLFKTDESTIETHIPKGRLVKGPYEPICRDCAIYFSITVN